MPKSKRVSSGVCMMCGTHNIPKRAMEQHLEECPKRTAKKGGERGLHILVTYPYDPRYFLHLEAKESVGLRTLDAFLRETWLECCGHMSKFSIGGQSYVAPEAGAMSEHGDQPMRARLIDVLHPGLRFSYEYDFGSTTELANHVLGLGAPKMSGGPIRLLARNEPIAFPCGQCGHRAAAVCVECVGAMESPDDEEGKFYCDACANDTAKHPHGDEMLLPVVNSPRLGVCGYEG